jgi:hypothetical protein
MFSMHGFQCVLNKSLQHEDYLEFQSLNHLFNRTQKQKVITEFELEDKVLRLATVGGVYDENGECEIEIKVPGDFDPLDPSRFVAEAYILTDRFYFGDKLTQIFVVDKDNVIGYGAGVVIERYYDVDAPLMNQGWLFYPTHQNAGEIEIEPLGGFARIPGGLYIVARFKKLADSPATRVSAMVWWGAKDNTHQ